MQRKAIPSATRRVVYDIDGHTCVYCGSKQDERSSFCGKTILSVDHLYPHSMGGSDKISNLVTSCTRCNSRKTNSLESPFERFVWVTSRRRKALKRWHGITITLLSDTRRLVHMINEARIKKRNWMIGSHPVVTDA